MANYICLAPELLLKSDYLNLLEHGGVYAVVADENDAPTLRQALESADYETIWKPALEREMKTLLDNGVLVLTPADRLPSSARALHGHVILTKKRNAEHYKTNRL